MNLRSSVSAAALSFAHLAGIAPRPEAPKPAAAAAAASAEEKDDDRQRDGESDDDYAKRKAKAKKEKDDEEEARAAKADDDEEEMRGNSPVAQARNRERARCAAIFASEAAGRNPVLAAQLAFTTRMTRSEALGVLEAAPAAAMPGARTAERVARADNPILTPGGGGAQKPSGQVIAAGWESAMKKAGVVA